MGKIICLITGEEAYAGNGGYTCRSISLLISYTTNVLIQNTFLDDFFLNVFRKIFFYLL